MSDGCVCVVLIGCVFVYFYVWFVVGCGMFGISMSVGIG